MDKYGYCYKMITHQKVFIHANEINENMEMTIAKKLKELEGRCLSVGYILKNSINMLERKTGIINMDRGKVNFDISFQMVVINPKINNLIPCKIIEVNKIGFLAHGGYDGVSNTNYPLQIVLIKQNHNKMNTNKYEDFIKLKKDDYICIKVLSTRCNFKDTYIKVSGQFEEKISKEEYEYHISDLKDKLNLNRE